DACPRWRLCGAVSRVAAAGDRDAADMMTARIRMQLRDLRRGIGFPTMAVAMLFVAFALRAALMPAQNDTFWHLRAGADIRATGAIPRVDHYSHTFAGAPWPDYEWLAQAAMFLVYRVGGMP